MKKTRLAVLTAVALLFVSGVAAGQATDEKEVTVTLSEDESVDVTLSKTLTDTVGDETGYSVTGEGNEIRVVVELSEYSPERIDELKRMGASVEERYRNDAQATVPSDKVGELRDTPWVNKVRRPLRPVGSVVSEGVSAINADEVQSAGFEGSGIDIGVIDGEGFDTSNSEISSNVAGTKSFDPNNGIWDGAGKNHGTAVAEIAVDTAPQADLYLANADRRTEFINAARWLENRSVDVIVSSQGYFNGKYDGTGEASKVVTEIMNNGTVWVNSVGNYGKKHWQGDFEDPNGDGTMDFSDPGSSDDDTNQIDPGSTLQAGQPIRASLSWNESVGTDQDYDLYLVNPNGDTVAQSTDRQAGRQFDRPIERLSAQIPNQGEYFVVVDKHSATGNHETELFVDGEFDTLEHTDPSSSMVEPATAQDVVAVGAFRYTNGQLEDYSSRGPTNDGRRGLDVIGPTGVSTQSMSDFFGTSAAAPHAGGLVGLMLEKAPGLNTSEAEDTLLTTSDLVSGAVNGESGYGRINATAAIDALNVEPNAAFTVSGTSVETGDTVQFDASGSNDDDGTVQGYDWRFGDGATATGTTVSHTYTSAGSYTVELTVTDDDGDTNTTSRTVTVSRPSTTVTADGDSAPPEGQATVGVTVQGPVSEVTVSDIPANWSVNASRNDGAAVAPDGGGDYVSSDAVVNWTWTNDRSGADVSATFDVHNGTGLGDYVLNVTAESAAGDRDETTATVTVQNCPVEAVVCDYGDSSGNVALSDLQDAIDDFIQNKISLSDLQAIIDAFVAS